MPPPAAIACSTLTRARQTIQPFLDVSGATVTYRDDLAEWHGGDWEFKEFEELLVEHPEIPERILFQDPLFFLAPGGETFAAFQGRVVGAIEELLAEHPGGDLWVVCHGGVINAYLGHVLGVIEQEMFFLPPNTSINTVKVEGDVAAALVPGRRHPLHRAEPVPRVAGPCIGPGRGYRRADDPGDTPRPGWVVSPIARSRVGPAGPWGPWRVCPSR